MLQNKTLEELKRLGKHQLETQLEYVRNIASTADYRKKRL
jgi:hypothetical protein